jgi:hypothetical protein
MRNVNVFSRLKFYVLSNGAIAFAVIFCTVCLSCMSCIVCLILCTVNSKWIKLFIETVLAFNLHFKYIGLNLQENQMHHSMVRNS